MTYTYTVPPPPSGWRGPADLWCLWCDYQAGRIRRPDPQLEQLVASYLRPAQNRQPSMPRMIVGCCGRCLVTIFGCCLRR